MRKGMIEKELEGIKVSYPDGMSEQEATEYAKHAVSHYSTRHGILHGVEIKIASDDENDVILTYDVNPAPFQRIRRVTGYLVGTLDRWNNAKRSEEHDRVKHGV